MYNDEESFKTFQHPDPEADELKGISLSADVSSVKFSYQSNH